MLLHHVFIKLSGDVMRFSIITISFFLMTLLVTHSLLVIAQAPILICEENPHFKLCNLDPEFLACIGKQIWKNEGACREEMLTFWSKHESFPSLGIGHNIWFPKGHSNRYTESFPLLCQYLKKYKVVLPVWLEKALKTGAPWKNREDFYNDEGRLKELRKLLVDTIPLQTQFMIEHLKNILPKIIDAVPKDKREKIKAKIDLMLASAHGTYILIDYLNFKGNGINPSEKSKGSCWGLLSVLEEMPHDLGHENIIKAFTVAAAKKLLMLIEHSAPDYKRVVFFGGWMSRLNTYAKPII